MSDDETAYYECDTCSTGFSGTPGPKLDDKLDAHEAKHPGHTMKETPL